MSSSRAAQGLILVSLVGVVAVSGWYGRVAWEDSGSFAFVLFGVPALWAAVALWAERPAGTMVAPAVIAVLGLVSVGWSLVTGLGIGPLFVVPSFLLLLAAGRAWSGSGRNGSPPART
ncbi:hypothetical protein [Blastococcus capsensis]|uniref:hypothetical protein n=1 Tax=Blastococcus capsensis TaxID=1564163 RepID=UPI00254004B8|nr:hypothetical protein [Blastococcus capsensis]MDK3258044.1 hypothetical protein [Blastococcus capsensis]MDK3258059.1 hypothetical protein [Blastococcus capsensis]